MFLDFYGLREQPFGVTPDPRYLYLSVGHREALASLIYGVESGRGFTGLELPADVVSAALFGAEKLFARGRFLYFPVLPQGLALYTRQLARTVLRGDVPATVRLSLLPPLASVAALAYGVAGSSERIW